MRAAINRGGWKWALLLLVFILVIALAATLGAPIPLSDLWSHDLARADAARRIFWRAGDEWGLRPTRILAGMLVGACLAMSGAALQAVFRNPLAEPYLLGTSAGGALGATLGLAWQSHAALAATAIAATAIATTSAATNIATNANNTAANLAATTTHIVANATTTSAATTHIVVTNIVVPNIVVPNIVVPNIVVPNAGASLHARFDASLHARFDASFGGAIWGAFDLPSVLAFCGSLGATALVYALGRRRMSTHARAGAFDRASLLLSGVAISSFLSALMSLVVALFNRSDLARQVMFWLLGGLSNVSPAQNTLLLFSLGIGLPVLAFSARDLNALRAGDEEAQALGVSVGALHRRLLVAAALMSSAAVASAGLIGFVGLLAPHLMRGVFGSDARTLAPASAIGGATLLVGCDAVARSIARPQELPVGIITALLGVPLFLFLARKN